MNRNITSSHFTNIWRKITSLPAGGAISGISSNISTSNPEAAKLWLCSPAGLFSEKDGVFIHQLRGIPFSNASAILSVGKTILAAGYPGFIIRSADGGHTWFSCWADGITAPVTCFAASAKFTRDATILAGSDGDGILRSTDGGNSWQLANFGLRSFIVLDLAWAPANERIAAKNAVTFDYDIVFAATEHGVYQSPNAGRAWRFSGNGIPTVPVVSIAVSPDFKQTPVFYSSALALDMPADHIEGRYSIKLPNSSFSGAVFAGTDGAGLYRSLDGGMSWQEINSFPVDGNNWSQATINTLYFDSQGKLYAGMSEQGILVSPDLGKTWHSLLQIDDVILRLAGHGEKILAGTAEHGLMVSEDRGGTWQIVAGLSARQVNQLVSTSYTQLDIRQDSANRDQQSSDAPDKRDAFLVSGLTEGIWANTQGEWHRINRLGNADWPADQPVIALQNSLNRFLALTPNHLFASQEPGLDWETLVESPIQFTSLACDGEVIILGSLNGEIWSSQDAGRTWDRLAAPVRNARILALQLMRGGAQHYHIYAVTRSDVENLITLWHAAGINETWTPLLTERINWQSAVLALLSPAVDVCSDQAILLATGTDIFISEQKAWRRKSITTPDAPVMALLPLVKPDTVLLSKPGELLLSCDRGLTWAEAGLSGRTITALSRKSREPHKVLALTSDGTIFEGEF